MEICDKYRWPFGETGHQRGGEGEGRSRILGGGMVGGSGEDREGRANLGREPSMPKIRRIQRARGASQKGERSKSLRRHRLRARVGGPMGREAELQQGEGKLIRPPGGLYFLEEGSEVV